MSVDYLILCDMAVPTPAPNKLPVPLTSRAKSSPNYCLRPCTRKHSVITVGTRPRCHSLVGLLYNSSLKRRQTFSKLRSCSCGRLPNKQDQLQVEERGEENREKNRNEQWRREDRVRHRSLRLHCFLACEAPSRPGLYRQGLCS